MLANGTAVVAGAFFGSMPPAGGFSQTAVNESSGSQTQVSELTTVALAVAAALFLGPVLDDLPEAILASLVVVAVIGLIKPDEIAFLARYDRLELAVAGVTALVGLTAGLAVAVAVGVAFNLLLLLRGSTTRMSTSFAPGRAATARWCRRARPTPGRRSPGCSVSASAPRCTRQTRDPCSGRSSTGWRPPTPRCVSSWSMPPSWA